MAIEHASDAASLIAELRRKYIWWEPIGDAPHSDERVIAQAMNLGTFDDIRRMERTLGSDRLADVMLQAAPAGSATVLGNSGAAVCRSRWANRCPRSRRADLSS